MVVLVVVHGDGDGCDACRWLVVVMVVVVLLRMWWWWLR